VATGEDVNDAEKVLPELPVVARVRSSVQNLELAAGLDDEELEELEGEAREPVSVGHHKLP
jgi:hypothetical protein